MASFILQLRNEGFNELANKYKDSLHKILKTSTDIASHLKQEDVLAIIVLDIVLLLKADNQKDVSLWARGTIDNINDEHIKKLALTELEKIMDNGGANNNANTNADPIEIEKQIYINMAEGLGIDLNNQDDDIARIVRIGILDLNPERVIKHCKHFFVSIGSGGLPAQWLHLPTAGSKFLHCTLHKWKMGGLLLDSIFETAKDIHCNSCNNRAPHPDQWKWTREWQTDQDTIFIDFVKPKQDTN